MNEEPNKQLLDLISSIKETTGSVKDFLTAETPEVIQQLLIWYGMYSFISFALGLILCIATIYSVYKMYFNIPDKKEDANVFHRLVYDFDMRAFEPIVSVAYIMQILVFVVGTSLLNLVWLKILLFPKLYLLEYAASLIKS